MNFRGKCQLKVPLKKWERHALVLSDEVFFHLNHSKWRPSHSFLSQNRAYAGIATQVSKETSVSIGYLNQFIFANTNQMSNILVLGLAVNFG